MGNINNCPAVSPKFPKTDPPPSKQSVTLLRSVSNPSLKTITEEEEKYAETSSRDRFSMALMEKIYLKYAMTVRTKDYMPADVITTASKYFENVVNDENILILSVKLKDSIFERDDKWLSAFTHCASKNPLTMCKNEEFNVDVNTLIHIMFVYKVLSIIMELLRYKKIDEVESIIQMIALSHTIMKVEHEEFQLMIGKLIKNLIHIKLVSEDVLPPLVYFMQTIISYIHFHMKEIYNNHKSLYYNMTHDGVCAPSREYYRKLRHWKSFVQRMRRSLRKPIAAYTKLLQEKNKQVIVETKPDDMERWAVVRCLKRGYKFRNKKNKKVF